MLYIMWEHLLSFCQFSYHGDAGYIVIYIIFDVSNDDGDDDDDDEDEEDDALHIMQKMQLRSVVDLHLQLVIAGP